MSSDVKRYYAVLGIDPDASDEEIRSAFRRQAKTLHPDAQSGNAGAFIVLKRAYDALIDPESRAAYDLACRPPPAPMVEPRREPMRGGRPPMPPMPPVGSTTRRGGISFVRYVVAFLLMAAISLGGVQAMISWTAAPPSIQTRQPASQAESTKDAKEPASEPSGPGSTSSGFWDATPPKDDKKSR